MDYRTNVIQLREPLYFYIFYKYNTQQVDHYLYTCMTKIISNLQQNSQKQKEQKRNNE